MGRPKKEKPNRADGLYEVKLTIGKTLEGKYIRKSFYSAVSKADARRQAEEWKIAQAVSEQTGEAFVKKDMTFAQWAARWLEVYKKTKGQRQYLPPDLSKHRREASDPVFRAGAAYRHPSGGY